MVKQFIHDTFEKIKEEAGELTIGTAKKAVEQIMGSGEKSAQKTPEDLLKKEGQNLPKNYTELDKKKLGETYRKQDDLEIEALKKRLFNNVQSGSEMAHHQAVNTEKERLRGYEKSPNDSNHKEAFIAPKGKAKKNIFGGRKKAIANIENKPAQGK
jgi:hypothetical protein